MTNKTIGQMISELSYDLKKIREANVAIEKFKFTCNIVNKKTQVNSLKHLLKETGGFSDEEINKIII